MEKSKCDVTPSERNRCTIAINNLVELALKEFDGIEGKEAQVVIQFKNCLAKQSNRSKLAKDIDNIFDDVRIKAEEDLELSENEPIVIKQANNV